MRTYAICNNKGGVGKTTTALELAYDLAHCAGRRVLFIDADSQGNSTDVLMDGQVEPLEGAGLAKVLRLPVEYYPELISSTKYTEIDLLPATEGLADYEFECTIHREQPDFSRLRDLLAVVAEDGGYDNVVIDCPPALHSVACLNAIAACDRLIIPAGVDSYSSVGLGKMVRWLDNIREVYPDVRVGGVLMTQWTNTDIAHDALMMMREQTLVPTYDTVIRRSVKAVESTWSRQAVTDWSPWSSAGRDYRQWVQELLDKEAKENGEL